MKKILFVAFAATLLAAGCQKTEIINPEGNKIGFSTEMSKLTKSVGQSNADNDGTANLLAQDFRVWSYYVADDSNTGALANSVYDEMEGKLVKAPGTEETVDGEKTTLTGWTPDKAYYWPGRGKDLKFFAVSGVAETVVTVNVEDDEATTNVDETNTINIPFTVVETAADVDLMVADYVQQNQGEGTPTGRVNFHFNHALSKIEFLFKKAEGTEENIFVQNFAIGKEESGSVVGGLIKEGTLTASTASDEFGTENAVEVQFDVDLDWDTEDSEEVVFEDDWTTKVADLKASTDDAVKEAYAAYPTSYTKIDGTKTTDISNDAAMVVTTEAETFTTWLMIPQNIEGKEITITYLINDRQFKVIFPLSIEEKLEEWVVNQYVRYTVTLSPNKITFGADVKEWNKGDVNLDESDPVYVEVNPTPGPVVPVTPNSVEATFGENTVTLYYEGELAAETKVFRNAELTEAAETGDYTLADGRVVTVSEGNVTAVTTIDTPEQGA